MTESDGVDRASWRNGTLLRSHAANRVFHILVEKVNVGRAQGRSRNDQYELLDAQVGKMRRLIGIDVQHAKMSEWLSGWNE